MSDFSNQPATVKARKLHQCDNCRTNIQPGELYRRTFGVWDGSPGVWKTHPECARAVSEYHTLCDLDWEDVVDLLDIEKTDHSWFLEHHPIVAARLGMTEP